MASMLANLGHCEAAADRNSTFRIMSGRGAYATAYMLTHWSSEALYAGSSGISQFLPVVGVAHSTRVRFPFCHPIARRRQYRMNRNIWRANRSP